MTQQEISRELLNIQEARTILHSQLGLEFDTARLQEKWDRLTMAMNEYKDALEAISKVEIFGKDKVEEDF